MGVDMQASPSELAGTLWHVTQITWPHHACCNVLHGHETESYGVRVMQGVYVKLQSVF